MQLRRRLTVLVTGVLLTIGAGTAPSALASAQPHAGGSTARQPVSCPAGDRAPADTAATAPPMVPQRYYHNDWRLGPRDLPRRWPLGPMMFGYHRLDHTSEQNFFNCYWNFQFHNWWFPKNNGFLLDVNGNPIMAPVTLQTGQFVDLFGSGTGRFLAPAGTLYSYRAIPPSNLDTYDPRFPFSYHLYRVLTPFNVQAGPAAPWFGQPGGGLQYWTGTSVRVSQLVQTGFLQEVPVLPVLHPHHPSFHGSHTLPGRDRQEILPPRGPQQLVPAHRPQVPSAYRPRPKHS